MLEGEKAARSLAAARLREAEKAAAALEAPALAAALSPAPAGLTPPPSAGEPLSARRAALQADVDRHSEQVPAVLQGRTWRSFHPAQRPCWSGRTAFALTGWHEPSYPHALQGVPPAWCPLRTSH